jgi:hypothetical protein
MPTPSSQPTPNDLPTSPWILVDDTTINQTAALLEALTSWLLHADPEHTSSLSQAISHGDTDPVGIASWTDALATRLRHCTTASEL